MTLTFRPIVDVSRDWLTLSDALPVAVHQRRMARAVMGQAIARVSEQMGVSAKDIKGRSRDKRVLSARWAVMRIGRESGLSYPSIAAHLNRDHTTVLHACKKMGIA
ncbi:helix-turn-helix domain-containing protein [Pyruvatibacter mobilis]|uniref:helix-turn-helix domain-containing protein n=1 Tax=Pyruvatibacter mobilis TaxID=1712261 RepID=UPI003BAEC7CD